LTTRSDTALISASDIAGKGRQAFLPDTNIYIMDAAGTLPAAATVIVDQGLMFHCAVCLAELSVGVGNRTITLICLHPFLPTGCSFLTPKHGRTQG